MEEYNRKLFQELRIDIIPKDDKLFEEIQKSLSSDKTIEILVRNYEKHNKMIDLKNMDSLRKLENVFDPRRLEGFFSRNPAFAEKFGSFRHKYDTSVKKQASGRSLLNTTAVKFYPKPLSRENQGGEPIKQTPQKYRTTYEITGALFSNDTPKNRDNYIYNTPPIFKKLKTEENNKILTPFLISPLPSHFSVEGSCSKPEPKFDKLGTKLGRNETFTVLHDQNTSIYNNNSCKTPLHSYPNSEAKDLFSHSLLYQNQFKYESPSRFFFFF